MRLALGRANYVVAAAGLGLAEAITNLVVEFVRSLADFYFVDFTYYFS